MTLIYAWFEIIKEEPTSETITLYVYDDYLDESKYVMEGKFEEFVASTANLPKSYQFSYGSSAKYSVSGNSVRVSADGIVEPKYTITYWWNNGNWSTGSSSLGEGDYDYTTKEYSYGDSTVTVTVDGKKTTCNISAVDYGEIYVEQVMWGLHRDIIIILLNQVVFISATEKSTNMMVLNRMLLFRRN